MSKPTRLSVIGSGLTGTLCSIFMARRGFDVDVFELRPDLRQVDLPAGRSINMALSHRGIKALKAVNLWEQIKPSLMPMRGRCIHPLGQDAFIQPYGIGDDDVLYSISRRLLNRLLLDAAEKQPQINIHFQHKCQWYDLKNNLLFFQNLDENEDLTVSSDHVFGTDGSFSALRKSMMRMERFNYRQHFIDYGYKELSILPDAKGKARLQDDVLHIWPRRSFMLIALPNVDGSFTCTLFMPFKGPRSFETLAQNPKGLNQFFKETFPDVAKLIHEPAETLLKHPLGSMVTIECSPWHLDTRALLLGDAAHAMVPFFGQGMNSAFEDCFLFDQGLNQADGDLSKHIPVFGKQRKADTDAISKMALENFVEMRDSVLDPLFAKRKALEREWEINPDIDFKSRYALVSFSDMPYADVYLQGIKNKRLLDEALGLV